MKLNYLLNLKCFVIFNLVRFLGSKLISPHWNVPITSQQSDQRWSENLCVYVCRQWCHPFQCYLMNEVHPLGGSMIKGTLLLLNDVWPALVWLRAWIFVKFAPSAELVFYFFRGTCACIHSVFFHYWLSWSIATQIFQFSWGCCNNTSCVVALGCCYNNWTE